MSGVCKRDEERKKMRERGKRKVGEGGAARRGEEDRGEERRCIPKFFHLSS